MISGTDMVIRGQDPFFGAMGSFAMQQLGLVTIGRDGLPTPIFRSNILDGGRDPSLTCMDYRMMDIYSRRMADVSAIQQRVMSRSVDRAFDNGSALGGFIYEKDANGQYVQSNSTIAGYNLLRRLATGPAGSSAIMGAVNRALGYDRGASGEYFAKNANAIVSSLPGLGSPALHMNADGSFGYSRPNQQNERYQRDRTTAAGLLDTALQNVMYNGGLVKDWGTTHGVSDALAARIMGDAARNGRLSHRSELSAEDKVRKEKADSLSDEIKANESKIAELREGLKHADNDYTRSSLSASIDRLAKKNENLSMKRKGIMDDMTSYEWDGDFSEMIKEREENENKIKRRNEVLYGKDGKGGLKGRQAELVSEYERERSREGADSGKLERIMAQIERNNAEIEKTEREIDRLSDSVMKSSKKLEGVTKSIVKEITGAVDVAKTLYGDSNTAYGELYRLTGGAISRDPGAGNAIKSDMRRYIDAGNHAGLSREFMTSMLGSVNQQVRSSMGSEGLFSDTALTAALSTHYATQAAQAMEGKDDLERAKIKAATEWRAGSAAGSDMSKLLVQLQSARQSGTISEAQYSELAEAMTSGDGKTRANAQRRLYGIMYDGDVSQGFSQLNDSAQMKRLEASLSASAANAVKDQMKDLDRNETRDSFNATKARRRNSRARANLKTAGVSRKESKRLENEYRVSGMRDALQNIVNLGGPNAEKARAVLEQMSQIQAAADDPDTGFKNAVAYMNSAGKDLLGDKWTDVNLAGTNIASREMERAAGQEVGAELSGGLRDFLSNKEGALNDRGHLTRKNLGVLGDVMFGRDSAIAKGAKYMSKEEQKRYSEARAAYKKYMDEGNVAEAQKVFDKYWSESSKSQKDVFAISLDNKVEFGSKTSDKNRENSEHEKTAAAAEWLRSRGEPVTDRSLQWAMSHEELLAGDEMTENQRKELDEIRDREEAEAHAKNTPGAEAIANFAQGTGKFFSIFKNVNSKTHEDMSAGGQGDDEKLQTTFSRFMSNMGYGDGNGDALINFINGSEYDEKGFLGELTKLGGNNAKDFGRILDMDHLDRLKNQMGSFQDAKASGNSKAMKQRMLDFLDTMAGELDENANELEGSERGKTEEGKKTLARQREWVENVRTTRDRLKNGAISLDEVMGQTGGGGKAGGAGGVSDASIAELISKIDSLVRALELKNGGARSPED